MNERYRSFFMDFYRDLPIVCRKVSKAQKGSAFFSYLCISEGSTLRTNIVANRSLSERPDKEESFLVISRFVG